MDKHIVYTKTAKGLTEAIGKTKQLSRGLRTLLKEIDGNASVAAIQISLDNISDKKLEKALEQLFKENYIRIFDAPRRPLKDASAQALTKNPTPEDIDFSTIGTFQESLLQLTMSAFYNAVEAQNAADATPSKEEPAAKPDSLTLSRLPKAIADIDPKIQELAEFVARLESEARTKQEVKENAHRNAEEARIAKQNALQAEQERTAQIAKELESKKAKERAGQEAKEQAKQQAEALARKQAEEAAHKEARMQAETQANIQAEREAQEKIQREAQAYARQQEQEKIRVEEYARKEALAKAEESAEAEERTRKETELMARHAAEELQRKVAQGRARMEAEKLARGEEEKRKAQEFADKAAQHLAEKRAQQAALESARLAKEQEKQAQREAEEQATRLAEEQKQREAEAHQAAEHARAEQARIEVETRERQIRDIAETARLAREQQARMAAEAKAKQAALQRTKAEEERQFREQQARLKAEAKARREALEHAKADEERLAREEQTRLATEAREKQEREAAEQARLAQEKARIEAEAKAQQAALEHAKAEEERLAREEQARTEAAAKAEQEALERAKAEQQRLAREEQIRLATEAREKQEREVTEQARLAQEKARIEAEAKAQQEALERAKAEQERRAEEQIRTEALAKAEQEALQRQSEEEHAMNEAAGRFYLETSEREQVHQLTISRQAEVARAHEEKDRDVLDGIAALTRQAGIEQDLRAQESIAQQAEEARLQQEAEQVELRKTEAIKVMHAQIEARQLAKQLKAQARTERKAQAASLWSARLSRAKDLVVNKVVDTFIKKLSILFAAGVIVATAMLHLSSFDRQAAAFEKSIAGVMAQPVKITGLYFALLPRPHWRAKGVTIGAQQQIQIPELSVAIDLTTLFSDKVLLGRIDLSSPLINEQAAGWLLFQSRLQADQQFGPVYVEGLKLVSSDFPLDALDGHAEFDRNGRWSKIMLATSERQFHATLLPDATAVKFDINADAFAVPFGAGVTMKQFHSAGTMYQGRLEITEFGGALYDGVISGNGTLKWDPRWSFAGSFNAIEINLPSIAPRLFDSGKMKAKGRYNMQAKSSDKLFSSSRIDGSFSVGTGAVKGVDIMNAFKNTQMGGRSSFTEMNGNFTYSGKLIQVRVARMNAGVVSAAGYATVEPSTLLNGRFAIDLQSPSGKEHADIALGGKLSEPKFGE